MKKFFYLLHLVNYISSGKFSRPKYIRDIRDIRSLKRSKSNTGIQSLNMFKSDIFNIRKVRIESNIKYFEFFGQPS